jgi:hypothetical protein
MTLAMTIVSSAATPRRKAMTKFLLPGSAAIAMVLIGAQAQAQNYPWCSNFADGAGTNCGFPTLEQCMVTVQGSGGYCDRNTQYKSSAAAPPPGKVHKTSSRNPS